MIWMWGFRPKRRESGITGFFGAGPAHSGKSTGTGLVVQHGRRGYSLPIAPAKFPAKVKLAWGELRER